MRTRRQITCLLAGINTAKIYNSHEEAEAIVRKSYPNAHKQGSAGGWSWNDDNGIIVAATCFVEKPPFGRHWLAIRPIIPAIYRCDICGGEQDGPEPEHCTRCAIQHPASGIIMRNR